MAVARGDEATVGLMAVVAMGTVLMRHVVRKLQMPVISTTVPAYQRRKAATQQQRTPLHLAKVQATEDM